MAAEVDHGTLLSFFVTDGSCDELLVLLGKVTGLAGQEAARTLTVSDLLSWRDCSSRSALHIACKLSLVSAAGFISKQGGVAAVNAADCTQTRPLHVAAENGHVEIVRILLENGAAAGAVDSSGVAAMHYAAAGCHPQVISILHDHGASLEVLSGSGTPLHWAAGLGQEACVRRLIDLGANVNVLESDGLSPLAIAALAGMDDIAILLADSGAWLFSSRLPNQTTLLHVCAEVGLEKLAARLLGSPQGRAEAKREIDGRLPIHVAAEAGHRSLVQLLLGHSGLAEGTTTEELMENASCAGLSSSDGALSPCGMSHQRTPLSALSMARATGPSPLMQAPCTALLWPVKTSQDFMAHSPITPPIPVSWPNEPTEAASTPEARISACRSSARGDQMVTENDLSGALVAYTDAIRFDGADASLWAKRAALHLIVALEEGLESGKVHKAYGDAVVATEMDPQSPLSRLVLGQALSLLGCVEDSEVQLACAREHMSGRARKTPLDAISLLEHRLLELIPTQNMAAGAISGSPSCATGAAVVSHAMSPRRHPNNRNLACGKVPGSPARVQLKKVGRSRLSMHCPRELDPQEDQTCSPFTQVKKSLPAMRIRTSR